MAQKTLRVVIIENDPFSRNWMALIVARDWRTRIVGELKNPAGLEALLCEDRRIDLILLDTDDAEEENWISQAIGCLPESEPLPAMMFIGVYPTERVLRQMANPRIKGYILKDEINYSLAWAVALASNGSWVITPSIETLANKMRFNLPNPCYVMDGRRSIHVLTEHQARAARLAFLFSMERLDLADELGIADEWSYGLVHALYQNLGVKDILSGEADPRDYLGDNELIIKHFKEIRMGFKGMGKSKEMESMAFHLLTVPEIRLAER